MTTATHFYFYSMIQTHILLKAIMSAEGETSEHLSLWILVWAL